MVILQAIFVYNSNNANESASDSNESIDLRFSLSLNLNESDHDTNEASGFVAEENQRSSDIIDASEQLVENSLSTIDSSSAQGSF